VPFAARYCHACGKSGTELCRCRCRRVWFCNRECQATAVKGLGHNGANCLPDEDEQTPASAVARSLVAAPSRPPTPVDLATLVRKYLVLLDEVDEVRMTNSRAGHLEAVDKLMAAAALSDRIGGAQGAFRRSDADQLLATCLVRLGATSSAAEAACSSLRAARASGSTLMLVSALATCGEVAKVAPDEMVIAEIESRERERVSGFPPSYGRLDLSQEGRISLPTTSTARSRLGLAYNEAALAIWHTSRSGSAAPSETAADPPTNTTGADPSTTMNASRRRRHVAAFVSAATSWRRSRSSSAAQLDLPRQTVSQGSAAEVFPATTL